MRVWTEKVYGIPPEQVVGSSIKTKFELRDGKPVLVRLPQLNFNDDKAGKPVAINQHIGRRPVMAFGNSVGDQQMLEYTQGGSGARFELLVLHDDAAREFPYGPARGLPDVKLGAFTPALDEHAKKDGWTVVSMKDDWKQVFAVEQTQVTAIDILLEPDATMIQHAEADNARLLKVFPKGFALDASHRPHVTVLQRYVRTADLDNVYAAVGKVLADGKAAGWKLKAVKYYYIPFKDLGLAGIVVEPTDDLLTLQQRLIDAVAPFTEKAATAAAFVTTPEDPDINQPTIDYIATFVPAHSGKHYSPHVTIGLASQEYLKPMLAEPFESYTFSPAGASVYQLGNMGTARTKLKTWELKP